MSLIKHPNPQAGTFTDRLGGVVFHDGYAEVDLSQDPHLLDAYRMHGYEVTELPSIVDLTTLSRADLRDIAATEGIEHPAKATKAELVDLISRAPAAPAVSHPGYEFAVVELPDGTVIGDGKSIATLYAADEA